MPTRAPVTGVRTVRASFDESGAAYAPLASIEDVSLLTIVPFTVTASWPLASVFAAARPAAVFGAAPFQISPPAAAAAWVDPFGEDDAADPPPPPHAATTSGTASSKSAKRATLQGCRTGPGSRIRNRQPAPYNHCMASTEDRPTTDELHSTISGIDVDPLYTPDTVPIDYGRDLGFPGQFPFTRGVYPSMYRGRLWTMRQFAGFGTAEETNERFRYLLEHGQTGLSTAFDMPTLMGYDSDHSRSLG